MFNNLQFPSPLYYVSVLCTICHIPEHMDKARRLGQKSCVPKLKRSHKPVSVDIKCMIVIICFRVKLLFANHQHLHSPAPLDGILKSFSLIENVPKILDTQKKAGTLGALHGVRVLCMLWIIWGHCNIYLRYGGLGKRNKHCDVLYMWPQTVTTERKETGIDVRSSIPCCLTRPFFIKTCDRS